MAKQSKAALRKIRYESYRPSNAQICANCRHWWGHWMNCGDLMGECQNKDLMIRGGCDHHKPTKADGTCDLWARKGESV